MSIGNVLWPKSTDQLLSVVISDIIHAQLELLSTKNIKKDNGLPCLLTYNERTLAYCVMATQAFKDYQLTAVDSVHGIATLLIDL